MTHGHHMVGTILRSVRGEHILLTEFIHILENGIVGYNVLDLDKGKIVTNYYFYKDFNGWTVAA